MNSLTLAYLGDSVYEIYIRKFLIEQGIVKVKQLQESAVKFVSAKNQAKFLKNMIDDNFLTEDEMTIVKRARNHKVISHPKNTDIVTYKLATGLEALIGYLEINKDSKRIVQIMKYITERG